MDSGRFDAFTRGLATVLSRRGTLSALAAVLAMLLEPFGFGTSEAKKKAKGCRKVGKKCGRKRNRKCCSHAKCRGGRCKCTGQKKACRGKCIPKSNCCDDADCGGGATCQGGVCNCPSGEKSCNGACIPEDDCCQNSDCGDCESCQDGACVPGCQSGQECQGGECVCNGTSCAGCCDDDEVCQAGTDRSACGEGGEVCLACGSCESCQAGQCLLDCEPGQTCQGGECTCGGAGCSGCCDDATCRGGDTPAFCGSGGQICIECATGQACQSGQCVCNGASCSGCCDGATCQAGTAPTACGQGGVLCFACQTCELCQGGTCVSNCPGGQICQGGVCVCPSGQKLCGATCIPIADCCTPCGPCEICDNGTCVSQCVSGQECVSGICRCTTTSCSTGCCAADETCRPGTNPNFCGTDGDICIECDQNETCPAGACICEAPFTDCSGQCVNLNNDDDHCGSCTNACVGSATCQSGACAAGGNYAFVREWDGAASGQAFANPLGVAVDSTGNVFVTDAGTNRVLKFTANGGFLDAWSSLGNSPYGIAVNRSSGEVYVANQFSDSVQVFSGDGTPGFNWTTLPQPAGVAVNPSSGEVYVSIAGADDAVQRFQSDGTLIETWAAPDYDFLVPEGVAVAPNGDVYVSNTGTCEILRFTADGDPLGGWGTEGSDPGQFEDPLGVAVDAAGDVYVCDQFNFRIQKFTADGDVIGQFGDDSNFGFPFGVAVSLSGYVYVADEGNANVQQFEPV